MFDSVVGWLEVSQRTTAAALVERVDYTSARLRMSMWRKVLRQAAPQLSRQRGTGFRVTAYGYDFKAVFL
jgi:hypothetical protein